MAGNHSRNKGHNFERTCAKDFIELGWLEARRNLSEYQIGGGIDLVNTGFLSVQCKCRKSYVPLNTIEEINGKHPLLLTKADRKPTLAVMYWEDLKPLLRHQYAKTKN